MTESSRPIIDEVQHSMDALLQGAEELCIWEGDKIRSLRYEIVPTDMPGLLIARAALFVPAIPKPLPVQNVLDITFKHDELAVRQLIFEYTLHNEIEVHGSVATREELGKRGYGTAMFSLTDAMVWDIINNYPEKIEGRNVYAIVRDASHGWTSTRAPWFGFELMPASLNVYKKDYVNNGY
jgi:hypothetical protein